MSNTLKRRSTVDFLTTSTLMSVNQALRRVWSHARTAEAGSDDLLFCGFALKDGQHALVNLMALPGSTYVLSLGLVLGHDSVVSDDLARPVVEAAGRITGLSFRPLPDELDVEPPGHRTLTKFVALVPEDCPVHGRTIDTPLL